MHCFTSNMSGRWHIKRIGDYDGTRGRGHVSHTGHRVLPCRVGAAQTLRSKAYNLPLAPLLSSVAPPVVPTLPPACSETGPSLGNTRALFSGSMFSFELASWLWIELLKHFHVLQQQTYLPRDRKPFCQVPS